MKALWNGAVLAESNDTVTVEGDVYFPAESVHREYLVPSTETKESELLGKATVYGLMVEGFECADAAWSFESPKPEASEQIGTDLKDYVAFGGPVELS